MNDIKARMKSVRSTTQITKAMELVATSKLRRAKIRAEQSSAYSEIAEAAMKQILGEENHAKYASIKRMVANRSPKDLGIRIKRGEIVFHHEVTNQSLWTDF